MYFSDTISTVQPCIVMHTQ